MRAFLLLLVAGCGFEATHDHGDGGVPTKCPHYGAFGNFYCDGFENGLNPGYQLHQERAQVSVDAARAYRGQSSLHFHSDPYDGSDRMYIDAAIVADDTGPVSFGASAAMRVFVFLPESQFAPLTGSFQLLSLGDLVVLDVNGVLTLTSEIANTPMPTDRWVCVEVRSEPADLGSKQTLLLDGNVVAEEGMALPAELHQFTLKLTRTGLPAPALDVWFDELAIDDSPILCDR